MIQPFPGDSTESRNPRDAPSSGSSPFASSSSAPLSPIQPTSSSRSASSSRNIALFAPLQKVSSGNSAASQKASGEPTPSFDPRMLLNPKAAFKHSYLGSAVSQEQTYGRQTGQESLAGSHGAGMSTMMSRLHNLSNRDYHPAKKRKMDDVDNETQNGGTGSTFDKTVAGPSLGKIAEDKPDGQASDIVDLTLDEECDDDVVMVKDTGDREVCLGKIDVANVLAYQVPAPKSNGFHGSPTQWPVMKVSFRRRPGPINNMVIAIVDPQGHEFGKLDFKLASALGPLLGASATNRIRVLARLQMRKKKPGEFAGMSISESLPLDVNLYAPLKMAQGIGRFLSQRQIYLRNPTFPDRGIELFNPHNQMNLARTDANSPHTRNQAAGGSHVARTVEEIRNDVIGMFDALTKSEDLPLREQDLRITTPLLKHQKQALYFLTDRETEKELSEDDTNAHSLWKVKLAPNGKMSYYNVITGIESRAKPPPVLGGILADMMGLGKTLSILSLVVDALDEAEKWSRQLPSGMVNGAKLVCNSKGTLLVAPVSTLSNWEDQIKTHLKPGTLRCYVYHGSSRTQDVHELSKYDLVLTTYSIIATEHDKVGKRPVLQTNWFRIVLDEAHMIRGQSTKQSQGICALAAQRRWAVTGTPVQNRLDDLGALIKFLRIKPFDERNGFTQYILSPFKTADPEILPKLRLLVDSITLRRLKDRIDLPPRRDRLVRLEFSDDERALYDWFAQDSAQRVRAVTSGKTAGLGGKVYVHILRAILRLRLVCAHGQELLSDEDMKLTEGLSYSNAIDLGDEEDDERPALAPKQAYDMFHLLRESDIDRCSTCNKKVGVKKTEENPEGNGADDMTFGYMTPCYQILCPSCIDAFKSMVADRITSDNRMVCPLCEQYVRVSFFELRQDNLDEDEQSRMRLRKNPKLAKQIGRYNGPHTKTKALLESLRESQEWSWNNPDEPPIKSVVFSGWTSHLDLIQIALEENTVEFARLDGSMTRTQRTAALTTFGNDARVCVLLISIGAGGLGLNLTVASRAYVMEPQFNPAAEAQAVDRVHRLGQRREVEITRFIMNGSFEEKILELQRKKRDLADLSMNRMAKLDKAEAAKRRLEELRSLFR